MAVEYAITTRLAAVERVVLVAERVADEAAHEAEEVARAAAHKQQAKDSGTRTTHLNLATCQKEKPFGGDSLQMGDTESSSALLSSGSSTVVDGTDAGLQSTPVGIMPFWLFT
jgi:hypothetical protein